MNDMSQATWQNPRSGPTHRTPLPKDSPWEDVAEAGQRLGVSEATIYRRLRSGALTAGVAFGRTVVARSSVEEYAARQARGEVPRDLRRRRGEDRPPTTWSDRYPDDRYVQTREASSR